MKEFHSLEAFAAHLAAIQLETFHAMKHGLEKVAEQVEKTAKEEIGTYQEGIGEFDAWEQLADRTKEDRLRKGFTENDPLLRTGELRDSISHQVHDLEAAIGSDSDIAVYQEMGTAKIPPRPFLGTAVEHNKDRIKAIIGTAVVRGLMGGGAIPLGLGYDHEL